MLFRSWIIIFNRKHRGENILRNMLTKLVSEFLSDTTMKLCLNPNEIYKNWLNRMETETGKPTGYSYDVTNQKALEYDEVRKEFEKNIESLQKHTSNFLNVIIESIEKIPWVKLVIVSLKFCQYAWIEQQFLTSTHCFSIFFRFGLRYIAKILSDTLKAKFPSTQDRDILKVIGNLVYYRYINSAICSPIAYDIIDMQVGCSLDLEQQKNLACVAKHLQLISMSKGVSKQFGKIIHIHVVCPIRQ